MNEVGLYPYGYAKEIADRAVERLKPHCERIEIACSIRRKKSMVKDIEILCIPKKVRQLSLFGEASSKSFTDSGLLKVVAEWEKVKGDLFQGKYTQRVLLEGIKLDLFTATAENWGNMLAVRTGPADYSHYVLACGWVDMGYKSSDGFLYRLNEFGQPKSKMALPEEEDLFDLLQMHYVNPEDRVWPAPLVKTERNMDLMAA